MDSSEESVTNPNDIAEDFVATFYRDSGEEVNTDEEEEGNLFDLYKNSRPLTPLFDGEQEPIEGTEDDLSEGRMPSDVEQAGSVSGSEYKPHQQHKHSTSTIKAFHNLNLSAKRDLASQFMDDQISDTLEIAEDPLDVDTTLDETN